MAYNTQHPEYLKMAGEWRMISDALDGGKAVKARGEEYLPKTAGMANASDSMQDKDVLRLYQAYQTRAQYPEWVRDAVRSMIGMVARLKPDAVLKHPKIAGMEYNATTDGYPLNQLFMRTVKGNIKKGRFGLLCDIDDDGNPVIATYEAESIINWKSAKAANGRMDLSLLVLQEAVVSGDDEFSHDTENEYLVYWLEDGACYSRRLNYKGEQIGEVRALTTGKNGALNFIPFVFSGAVDNVPDIDIVPLSTMMKAALKSYQISADYFQELHLTAHPQPVITGQDLDGANMVTGPMLAWVLPQPEANAFYLEISGNGIEAKRQAMQEQKSAALEAGARVMDIGGQESGEARMARQNDQYATLQGIVRNSAEAVEQCLRYFGEWYGLYEQEANDKLKFAVDLDFSKVIDTSVLSQMFSAAQLGMISPETAWNYLQTGKVPERSWDDEQGRILNSGLGMSNVQP